MSSGARAHRAARPSEALARHLARAEEALPRGAAIARDPVRFPRSYAEQEDREVAAVLAACCAFGRVELFGPVVARALAVTDRYGGPGAFARRFDPARAAALEGVAYRWNRTEDFVRLFALLGQVLQRHGSVGALFAPGPAARSLGDAMDSLRALAGPELPRSFRTWLPHPREGSACKRWLMLMRWMVRRDEVDLGLWSHLSPRDLVMPLDTHVSRIARFVGLTQRQDAGWRTAEEVTAALRHLDPEDPVRFDFALAHLGISGGCLGRRDARICPACPLEAVCGAPAL